MFLVLSLLSFLGCSLLFKEHSIVATTTCGYMRRACFLLAAGPEDDYFCPFLDPYPFISAPIDLPVRRTETEGNKHVILHAWGQNAGIPVPEPSHLGSPPLNNYPAGAISLAASARPVVTVKRCGPGHRWHLARKQSPRVLIG